MPDYSSCVKCGSPLDSDDVGATKKFINRGAHEFLCVPCIALRFGVEVESVRRKIEECRDYGCSLFPPKQ